ncbi:unnamed protein product [Aureobasidium mustum]|uniref:Uncharacterized protein n=1 Tax=Aureobasidium mustum TaxID=2773714 RepID=A0A9N8PH24_9PEZI|nr:unnamed protein product [Aureobasidium mustum]
MSNMNRPTPQAIDTQSSNALKRVGHKLVSFLSPKKSSFSPTSPEKTQKPLPPFEPQKLLASAAVLPEFTRDEPYRDPDERDLHLKRDARVDTIDGINYLWTDLYLEGKSVGHFYCRQEPRLYPECFFPGMIIWVTHSVFQNNRNAVPGDPLIAITKQAPLYAKMRPMIVLYPTVSGLCCAPMFSLNRRDWSGEKQYEYFSITEEGDDWEGETQCYGVLEFRPHAGRRRVLKPRTFVSLHQTMYVSTREYVETDLGYLPGDQYNRLIIALDFYQETRKQIAYIYFQEQYTNRGVKLLAGGDVGQHENEEVSVQDGRMRYFQPERDDRTMVWSLGKKKQPLVPEEETITSTRHIHITRTITNSASTIYAVRMGSSTVYMEYLPATMMAKSVPWQAIPATHLELRSEATSTMHIKVTQTVAQVQSTIFASKIGTSVSTITNAPQSLIDEAAKDAAELSSSQMAAAVSSAQADALTHSTVALLAGTVSSAGTAPSSAAQSSTQPEPPQNTNSSSVSAYTAPLAAGSNEGSSSSDTAIPIGLELRSNAGATTAGQQQATMTEAPATVVAVIFGSSTSIMTSVPPSLLAGIASSQISATSTSAASTAIDANAAQVKSTQTALIQSSSDSDEATVTSSAVSSSATTKGCFGECSSSTSSSQQVVSSISASSTSNKVYTIPVTISSATSTSSVDSASTPASTAADIAADNAAGASGGDSGSFQLSKEGFAAIISVVSIGVGLGILFVIARRRQWKVRQSIVRASRRITGRFSSHPNRTALRSEKEPTLPIIEPRQPMGPRPAPSSRRQQGFANIDATLHTNYRGVETVGRSASRGPEAWRKAMAKERLQQSQSQRKKPELRVDTGVASRMEEGRGVQGGQKKRGDWKDLFRAL